MLERSQIIAQLKHYFSIKELVCDHTYQRWGEASWQFLDTEFLHCLLIIRRDILKSPMVCNGNAQTQRGLRCNKCAIVKNKANVYLSPHILGKAGDFTVKGMSAEQARTKIKLLSHILPYNIRLENGVSWLHFDVLPQYGTTKKTHEFNA